MAHASPRMLGAERARILVLEPMCGLVGGMRSLKRCGRGLWSYHDP